MSAEYALSRLDSIAQEIRFKSERLAMDMVDIGKSLSEAKTLVKHGEWGTWLRENTSFSERTAQVMMQANERFGTSPAIASLGWSKIVPLLSLPEGTEDEFIQEHDVGSMSVRDLKKAVQEEKHNSEEENAQIAAMGAEMDQLREQLNEANSNFEQVREQLTDSFETVKALREENAGYMETIRSRDGMIQMLNEQMQESMTAPSESSVSEVSGFRVEDWSLAVSEFIARFASLPYSGVMFSAMRYEDKKVFYHECERMQRWLAGVMDEAKNEALVV